MPKATSRTQVWTLVFCLGLLVIGSALATSSAAQDDPPVPVPIPVPESLSPYAAAIEAHLDYLTEHSRDEIGDESTALWLATIDIRNNWLPKQRLPSKLRWHRRVTSPSGSNLYWDQPSIVAAMELSVRTGCACYEDSVQAYLRDSFQRCMTTKSGLLDWGHQRYYDVEADKIATDSGGHHVIFPHVPAWNYMWDVDHEVTKSTIEAIASAHVRDFETGLFSSRADPNLKPNLDGARALLTDSKDDVLPTLEAGAVLIESLCWLDHQTEDPDGRWAKLALRMATYSASHRHPNTGLIPNQPVQPRWDRSASTTEIGLWASGLLRAGNYTEIKEFEQLADQAMRAWLKHGFDPAAKKYFGRLSIESGKSVPLPNESPAHLPPLHAEIFDLQEKPTGNYPMQMAEACLSLYEITNNDLYRTAVERWIEQLRNSLPANGDHGAYAEDYGRAIHFSARASKVLDRPQWRELATEIADEAMDQLYVPRMGMFRSHPGEDRCDAVDGPGVLLLALLYLDGSLPDSAFHF